MPYTINKTNGTLISTVQDGTVDAKSLDITLVGKNYSGYGNIFNENFVQMLENFAATTPPTKPLVGELWFNSASKSLKVNTGVGTYPWKSVGIIENSDTKPAGYNAGDLWWKTSEGRLYAYTGAGTDWTLVGPLTSKTGTSGALTISVLKGTTGSDSVLALVSGGDTTKPQAIVSNIDTLIASGGTNNTDPIYSFGYPYLKEGITLPQYSGLSAGVSYDPNGAPSNPAAGTGYILWGTAASAVGMIDRNGLLHYSDEYLLVANLSNLGKINVVADAGVLIGQQNVELLHVTDTYDGNITNIQGGKLRFNIGTRNTTSTQGGDFYNIFYITTGSNNSSYIMPNSTATVYIGTATQTFDYAYINTATFTTVNASQIYDTANRVVTSVVPSGTTYLGVSNLVSTGTGVSFALTNLGVQTITGSTYLGASSSTGTITLTNLGVGTLAGTANQILVNGGTAAATGTITLTLPQSIATTNSPTFAGLTITDLFAGGAGSTGTVHGAWNLATGATFLATYADLAERYAADDLYTPGTVLVIGGTQEVTVTTERASIARAGIVSTNPAFTLNATAGDDTTHPYIALKGRVPCKVTGMIKKGDLLVTSTVAGHAEAAQLGDDPNAAIGRALENFVGDSGIIEVMVI